MKKRKLVKIWITKESRKRLKIEASQKGLTMIKLIEEKLKVRGGIAKNKYMIICDRCKNEFEHESIYQDERSGTQQDGQERLCPDCMEDMEI